jgi:hemerythrin-like domain-containing protein
MLEQPRTTLIQFFQHAHHRVEGWLMSFRDGLEKGTIDQSLLELAAASIRQHMYVEEELLFPRAEERLAEPIADLLDDHGYLSDLIEGLRVLLGQKAELAQIRKATARSMNFLAAHSAKEDMGVYPDLMLHIGQAATLSLLKKADATEPPTEWVCLRRRIQS